jgi:ABC-type multidrug transport system ATPase subunit
MLAMRELNDYGTGTVALQAITMAPMPEPILAVHNLAVRHRDRVGIADVSLEVTAGSVVALLGSNGAGKTTTLNAIAVWFRWRPETSSGRART